MHSYHVSSCNQPQLYYNTLLSYRVDTTTLCELSSSNCSIYAQNNIMWSNQTTINAMYDVGGTVTLATNAIWPNLTSCEETNAAGGCNGSVVNYNNTF